MNLIIANSHSPPPTPSVLPTHLSCQRHVLIQTTKSSISAVHNVHGYGATHWDLGNSSASAPPKRSDVTLGLPFPEQPTAAGDSSASCGISVALPQTPTGNLTGLIFAGKHIWHSAFQTMKASEQEESILGCLNFIFLCPATKVCGTSSNRVLFMSSIYLWRATKSKAVALSLWMPWV